MKVDPIGSIPEGWITTNVGDVSESIDYGFTASATTQPVGPKMLRITDIQGGRVNWDAVPYCKLPKQKNHRFGLKSGDIVFARTGATTGKSFLIRDCPVDAVYASYLIRVRPNKLVTSQFLFLFFQTSEYWEMISEKVSGNAQPNCNATKLGNLTLPLPPLAEQRRIVAKVESVLARVNAARDRLAKVPALLKRFRQSTLAAACSGELTADWREKNSYEREWPSVKLGAIGEVSGGITKNATRTSLPRQVPYLRVANVYQDRLELGEVLKIGVTDAEFKRTVLKTGDLLFVEGNGSVDQIGRVARWDGSVSGCVHQNHLIRFRAPAILDSKFVLLAMMSPPGREQLMNHAISSAGLHSLSISKIAACDLPLPQLTEQHEIVRRVEALFALADKIEARVAAASARADKLIQSTLAKAFRGELVPNEHALAQAAVIHAQKIDEGLAVLYALALLYTWKASPDRRAFELGMILMQKDGLRQRVLKGPSAMPPLNTPRPSHLPSVGRIDEFIGELAGTSTISVTNRQTRQLIALGTNAPAKAGLLKDSVGKKAFIMADEAVRAVAALDKLGQSLDQYSTADDYDTIEIAISGV